MLSRAKTAPAPSSRRAAGAGPPLDDRAPKDCPSCSGLASTTTRAAPARSRSGDTVSRPGCRTTPGAEGWLKNTKSASPATLQAAPRITADRSNGPGNTTPSVRSGSAMFAPGISSRAMPGKLAAAAAGSRAHDR